MPKLELRDNSQQCEENEKILHLYIEAIERLKNEIHHKQVRFCNLGTKSSKTRKEDFEALESMIDYNVVEYHLYNGDTDKRIPKKAKINAGCFVGFYQTKIGKEEVWITIKPRFGEAIANYLYSRAMGVFLFDNQTIFSDKSQLPNDWLLGMLWVGALEGAIRQSGIAKAYCTHNENLSYFRGRLDVNKQILHNLTSPERLYCQFSKQSYDIPINRTICKAYSKLRSKGFLKIPSALVEHIAMLRDFGVKEEINLSQIDQIRYTPMTRAYERVIELSKIILGNAGQETSTSTSKHKSQSFFLDMSEVWENYLAFVMCQCLPNKYRVVNGNLSNGVPIFTDGSGMMYPDFRIYEGDELIAVLDAKYKGYEKIDEIQREDLYQMMSYIYRLQSKKVLVLSPNTGSADQKPKEFQDTQGKILLCGIDLNEIKKEFAEKFQNINERSAQERNALNQELIAKIQEKEREMCQRIQEFLENSN